MFCLSTTRLALFVLLLVFPMAACDCGDDLGNLAPAGLIEPAHFDFGPVPAGTECQAELSVVNTGQSDFEVSAAEITDANGDFSILIPPKEVALGRSEKLLVKYVASGSAGNRESGTVQLTTDIPTDEGMLYASLTGIPTDGQVALATVGCASRSDDTVETPCSEVDFGAVTIDETGAAIADRLGLTLEVLIINEGTETLGINLIAIDQGSTEFGVMQTEFNGSIVEIDGEEPFRIPAGRTEDCGALVTDGSNQLAIKVKYSPTNLGADSDVLKILTDAVEGGTLEVPLMGYGAKQGLVFTPEYLNLNAGEGSTQEETIVVTNSGSAEARVNTSCIDLSGDGTCDGDCTGGDPVLEGALFCDVVGHGKGFILEATDAAAGGDDEATIEVTWAPVAGSGTIPAGSVLRLESNILGDKVYEIQLLGGVSGILNYDTDDRCDGFSGVCLLATGTQEDTTTWVASGSFTVTNSGDATVVISNIDWDADSTATTVSDDFDVSMDGSSVIGSNPGVSIAPSASKTFNISYANNDASTEDIANLQIEHSGEGGLLTVSIGVSFSE